MSCSPLWLATKICGRPWTMLSNPSISTRARLSQRLSFDHLRIQKCWSLPLPETKLPRIETVAHKTVLSAHPVQHQIVNSLALSLSIGKNLPSEEICAQRSFWDCGGLKVQKLIHFLIHHRGQLLGKINPVFVWNYPSLSPFPCPWFL
jgi:hypothetical protein